MLNTLVLLLKCRA